ncbi:MAG: peptidoglycan recognition family protein [Planctomycetota bacterium]|jgi:hypothetical protein
MAFMSACAGAPPSAGTKGAFQPPTVVGKSTTFAPSAMHPDAEIGLLARTKTPAALLRVAWLHLQQRRPQNALDAVAEVLYGPTKPSAHEESFARYLRAEAFAADGNPERGTYDRDLARQLAIDPELRKLLGPKVVPPTVAESPPAAGLELAVQPRSQWKAAPHDPGNVEPMAPIHRVTIHHSAMYFRDTRPNTCAAQIKAIQQQHMTVKRWGDIGYHFLIDPSGRIWQGRQLRFQGAHATGEGNVGNVGICLLGNFMRTRRGKERGQEPTREQVAAMRQLVAELMRKHNFGADAIFRHYDFRDTECPGELMTPIVSQMVKDFRRNALGEQ